MEPVSVALRQEVNGTPSELPGPSCSTCSPNGTAPLHQQLHSGLLGMVLGSLSLLTVFMNILVLYAVRRERLLHTVGNLYIVSLSVADLIVGTTVMPLNLAYLLEEEWTLGRAACQFWLVMDYVASTASIFSLFILCLDRYRSVRQPLRYLKYRTRGRATLMISGAWLLSLLWAVPILGWRSFAHVEQKPETEKKCDTDFRFVTWFKVLTAILNFYVPSVLMLWFYSRIFLAVREHYRQWEDIFSPLDSPKNHGSGLQGAQQVCHSCSLEPPPGETTQGLLDQYSLEQHVESRETNQEDMKASEPRTVRMLKSLHRKGLCVSAKSTGDAVQDSGNSLCSLQCAEVDSDSSSKVSVLHLTCPQSPAKEGENDHPKVILSLNSCDVKGANSIAGVCEVTSNSDIRLAALAGRCSSPPGPLTRTWSSDSSQNVDSSKAAALKQTWEKLRDQSKQCVQNLRVHKERKAAQQLGFIIAGFMVCWIPYFITFMVMAFCTTCVHHDLHMFTIWLGYINSTLNPFIYPMCNENFKRVFKRIFHIST